MDSRGMGAHRNDAFLIFFLISFVIAARLLLHVPNVSPVAASALFAGMMLRSRALALVVPLAAMLIGDFFAGFYDWRVMAVVYAALTLPAVAGILARRYRASRVVVPTILACSLIFFATDESRGMGVQRPLQPRHGRPAQLLCRRPAVPEIHRGRRPVLGRSAVRRRLAGAALDGADHRPCLLKPSRTWPAAAAPGCGA